MVLFLLPKARDGSADGAARGKGGVLFRKREHPLYIPQRKAYIAGLALEELHTLRNRLRCTWLRHESSASRYRQQPRALRSARVTVVWRRTACAAAALLRSPPIGEMVLIRGGIYEGNCGIALLAALFR